MIECQVAHIVAQVQRLEAESLAWVDVRRDVQDDYNDAMQSDIAGVTVWAADCRGYYAHASGRVVTQWPHDMDEYLARTGTLRPGCYESAPAGGGGARL